MTPEKSRSRRKALTVVLVLLVQSSRFFGQTPTPSQDPKDSERYISVSPYSPTAESETVYRVTVYTEEFMREGGANTPIEGLRLLPSFVGTTRTENDSVGGDGRAFINRYALGSSNVLSLINGRRAFSFSDINAIPIGGLSRAEIVEGNAYGSDSTAGVVNFVMLNGPAEKPYEGAELHVLYGNTTDADAHVRQVV